MASAQLNTHYSDDTVFNMINKMFISLDKDEIRRNNIFLHQIMETLINLMKQKDTLFAKAYRNIIFCGSFYKGTKVSNPNEFDLNIILKLPIKYDELNFYSDYPAFTKIQVENGLCMDSFQSNLSNTEKKTLLSFMTENYINPDKFRQWFESILSKVVRNEFPLIVNKWCSFRIKKSGPAFTLMLNINEQIWNMDVDIVPALLFKNDVFDGSTIEMDKLQNCQNKTWFAIAPLTKFDSSEKKYLHWRHSFYYQEREILSKYGRIKPVIRQMKKLRDVQNWQNLASYYIETLCMNNLEELEEILNTAPFKLLFFIMLKELHCAFQQHEIKYYWDTNYNLLEKIGESEMMCMAGRLNNIIKVIEHNISDPFIIATYVLTADELDRLMEEYTKRYNSIQYDTEPARNWNCVLL